MILDACESVDLDFKRMKRGTHVSLREALVRAALMAAGALSVVGVVVAMEAGIRLADPELMVRVRSIHRYHPRLGWEVRPNLRVSTGGIKLSLDEGGNRLTGEEGKVAVNRPHILILGDSVAFGLGVSDEETFGASLSQGESPYRVTNMAVPGYGPGQSLLTYEAKGRALQAAVVIFALCLGNDLADVVSRHHLYDENIPKPRFFRRGGELELEDDQVRRAWFRGLLDNSFLLARFAPPRERLGEQPERVERRLQALRARSAEAEDTVVAIVKRLRKGVERHGARFLVVAFPDERALDPASTRWPGLREKLAPEADLLDLVPVLAQNRESFTRYSLDHIGHLSRRGHERAAKEIRLHLEMTMASRGAQTPRDPAGLPSRQDPAP